MATNHIHITENKKTHSVTFLHFKITEVKQIHVVAFWLALVFNLIFISLVLIEVCK